MTEQTPTATGLSAGFINDVITTGQPQTLRFYVTNVSAQPIALTGSQPWLALQFVAGNGAGALATASALAAIGVTAAQGDWTATAPTASSPGWKLQPPAGGSLASQETVVFDISNLVVTVPGITQVRLDCPGIAAAAGQAFTLPVVKLIPPPAPQIAYFKVLPVVETTPVTDPPTINLTGSAGNGVQISFRVANASQVFIDGGNYMNPAGTASVSYSLDIWKTTQFRLYATNNQGQITTASARITVTPSIGDQVPNQAVFFWNGAASPTLPGYENGLGGQANGKYFIGAGQTYAVGASGPGDTHTHAIAPFQLTTDGNGNHGHSWGPPRAGTWTSGNSSASGFHSHTFNAMNGLATKSASAGRPPWYALAFIIKDY